MSKLPVWGNLELIAQCGARYPSEHFRQSQGQNYPKEHDTCNNGSPEIELYKL
jgi:hypothetical protein